jgi:hypothetical protein
MESAWKNLASGCDLPTEEGGPRDTVEPGGDGTSRFRGPSAWRPLAWKKTGTFFWGPAGSWGERAASAWKNMGEACLLRAASGGVWLYTLDRGSRGACWELWLVMPRVLRGRAGALLPTVIAGPL